MKVVACLAELTAEDGNPDVRDMQSMERDRPCPSVQQKPVVPEETNGPLARPKGADLAVLAVPENTLRRSEHRWAGE
jgi:hypothetical protein